MEDLFFDSMRLGSRHREAVSRCRIASAVLRARAEDAAQVVEASRQALRDAGITLERARQLIRARIAVSRTWQP